VICQQLLSILVYPQISQFDGGTAVGLFSKKDQTIKPGSFQVAWPKESGLGVGPYSLEAEAQERYLIYTADRRSQESVPVEDMPVMQAANSLLFEMAAGTPVNELPLIQGPIDINWISASVPMPFPAEMLITDRRVLVWWASDRDRDGLLLILHHFEMIPREDVRVSMPFDWSGGIRIKYPIGNTPMGGQMPRIGVTFGVHFSKDEHGNRRSMSVYSTLLHLESEVRSGRVTPEYRL
jgi:hypothetical protein